MSPTTTLRKRWPITGLPVTRRVPPHTCRMERCEVYGCGARSRDVDASGRCPACRSTAAAQEQPRDRTENTRKEARA